MQLSNEVFAELVGAGAGVGQRGPEQRRAPRVAMYAKAKATLIDLDGHSSGPTYVIVIRDMSLVGVGFLTSARLERGQKLMLVMPRTLKPGTPTGSDASAAAPMRIRCTVKRSEQMTTSMFSIGAEFDEVVAIDPSAIARGNGSQARGNPAAPTPRQPARAPSGG